MELLSAHPRIPARLGLAQPTRVRTSLMVVSVLLLVAGNAKAQAFCALRDPVAQIYAFYGEADGYRSVVRTIGGPVLQSVSNKLGYGLHRSELGRHTVYVAMRGEEPLGLVHVRSERSRWGLVEVAWALDKELRVVDFAIQRCRSSMCTILDGEEFRSLLQGRGLNEIATLLTDDGRTLRTEVASIPGKAHSLSAAILRNGLKTIVVTDVAWGDVIVEMRDSAEPDEVAALPVAQPGNSSK